MHYEIDMKEARDGESLIEVKVKNRRMAQFVTDLIAPLPIDHQALIEMSDEEGVMVFLPTLSERKDIMVCDVQQVVDGAGTRLLLTGKEHLFSDGSQPVKSGDVMRAVHRGLMDYTRVLSETGVLHTHQPPDEEPS